MNKLFLLASIVMLTIGCTPATRNMKHNTAIQVITTRVSVRNFTQEKPSAQQIDTLLRCAMSAPSALNTQPWAFIVVDNAELLSSIGSELPNSRVQNGCQVCFVMCGDLTKALQGTSKDFWINDVSAATENLLLAAHAMGLGAVWTGLYPNEERVAQVRNILHLPQHIVPMCIVPVGYPAETPEVKDKYKEENIHYNQW